MDGKPEEDAVLILSRRLDESIVIPEHGIRITVTHLSRTRVTLGIEAPLRCGIVREEIAERYGYGSDERKGERKGGEGGGDCGEAGSAALPAPAGGAAAPEID